MLAKNLFFKIFNNDRFNIAINRQVSILGLKIRSSFYCEKGELFLFSARYTNKGQQELQIRVKSRRLYIPFYQQKPMIMGAKNKHIHPYSQIIFFIAARLKKKYTYWFPYLGINVVLVFFYLLNLFIIDINRF